MKIATENSRYGFRWDIIDLPWGPLDEDGEEEMEVLVSFSSSPNLFANIFMTCRTILGTRDMIFDPFVLWRALRLMLFALLPKPPHHVICMVT